MADIENGKVKDNIDTVQVALRIRPLMQQETDRGCDECIDVVLGENQVQIKDLAFTYNYVFAQHITQQEFYDTAVKGLIGRLFQGYNVTILAYGQTGSGKTYTMGTNYSGSHGDSTRLGVIPQAVADIFDFIDAHEDQFIFKISVSFMELYQEQCYDLLSGKEKGHSIIEIREDINKGVVLPGLTELAVSSTMETMLALERGSSGRVTGSIPMNQASSRSHAVFTIHITKESRTNKNIATTSKFHLVDLAGSERLKKTKASGKRLKEGVKINQGLLALGNVISALGDGTKRSFISYRDSKLTRLLQDSLGGNSLTLIVACVSPADYNLDETLSTLRYADRARRIRNKPITNQDDNAAEILRLNNLVNKLRLHLQQNNEQLDRERQRYAELEKKYQKATEHLSDMLVENTNLCEKALSAEAAKDKIERKLNELTEECNQTIGNLTASESVDDDKQKSVVGNLKEIKSRLEDLQSVSLQTNEQLIDHEIKLSTISDSENDKIDVDEDQAVIEEEKRTIRQVKINKELQELIRAMAYKASMLQVILVNNKEMLESHTNLRDIEEKIEKLEKERDELLQQLKQTKSKDPKHEERRTKVSTLEHDISELKKRNQQQANIIKIKEKNEAKRATLNAELQAMKCTKLKIIKQLREESEKVRKRKADKERAMLRLKNEDRKRATAMAKMETLHAKQQNVLKRNMEEAVAVNKRLKVRRPCFIMKKTGIPSPARSVGPPVKPRRHKPRASRSVGSPALSNASGRLSTPVQKFQEENMDSFVMSPVDIKSVLSDSTDIDLPRRKSWWKNLDDNYEDVMEVCRKNSVDEMENILDYYLDGDTLTQQKLDHIMDVLESSDSESIASIVLPQRRLFIYKDSHLANWPNIKSREAHAKLDKTEVEDKTLLVETKKLLGQKQRTVRPTFPKALITLPNRTLSNDELSDVEVKKLFRPKHTKKRSSLFSDTDHDSEKEANEPGTSGPRNLFGRHKKRTKFNFPVLDIEHSIADEEQSGVKIDKQNEKKEEEIKHIDENRSVVEDIGENEQSDEENRNQGEKSIEIDQDEENYEQEKENSEVIDQSFAEKQENEESDDQYVGDIAESGVEEDENNDQSVAKEQEDEYKKSDDQNIEDSVLEMELNYEDDDMSVLEEQQSEHESDNENLEVVDDNDVVTDQSIEENEPNDHSDEQDKDEQENYEEIDHDDLKEDVEQSWKAPRQNVFNDFKFPLKPGFKPAPKKAKSKAKPSNVLLSALPPDLRKELNNKPAKRFNRVFWCTKRLYKFLETKLKPKYDNMAREHAENLVEKLYVFGKNIKKYSVASQESIKELKHEMARLKIVKTHFEFYNFFKEYMPNEMRIKVVPDRANKLPLPKDGVFVDILRESVPGPCDKLF